MKKFEVGDLILHKKYKLYAIVMGVGAWDDWVKLVTIAGGTRMHLRNDSWEKA